MIWKAVFIIKNYVVEKSLNIVYKPFSSEITYEFVTDNKKTLVTLTFDAVHVSKPPVLQEEQAQRLFSMLKEISVPFIAEKLDTELIELVPLNEKDNKEYESMKTPENWAFSPEPKIISGNIVDKIENSFLKVYSGKLWLPVEDAQNHMILTIMIKWYNRSLEYKGTIDKFISFCVTFNVIYNYMWRYYKKDEKQFRDSEKILKCIRRTLSKKECMEILKPYEYIIPEKMPLYELLGTQEEIDEMLKHKNLKKLKESHKKYLEKEKKESGFNQIDYLVNKRGLNFGLYWYVGDWVNSLAEVMLRIYGLRNIVFHGGQIPMDDIEGMTGDPDSYQYWDMVNDILSKVNARLITKVFDHFSKI